MVKNWVFILLLVCKISSAQNLISNGGFETYTALPTTTGLCDLSTGWDDCNGNGSPDYFHTNGSGGVQLPNCFVSTVYPQSGSAIMGIALFLTAPNFREYISTNLISPLVVGTPYRLTLFVTNGNAPFYFGGFASDHFSIALTTYPLQASPYLINLDAQLIYNGYLYNHSWQQVEFYFIPDSAYEYLTVGSFVNDQVQQLQFNDSVLSFPSAYYFIDDIELYPVTSVGESIISNSASVFPNPCTDWLNVSSIMLGKNELILYDAVSQKILQCAFTGSKAIDVKNLKPGIYYYEVTNDKGRVSKGTVIKT